MKKPTFLPAVLLAGLSFSGLAHADDAPVSVKPVIHNWSVGLSTTRVIYDPDSRGADVTVTNPNDYPVLVQSGVVDEDKKTQAPFIVTPPLFRLDAHQKSRLKVVRTGAPAAADRETLSWLCVTGIPPEQGDAWAGKASRAKNTATLDVNVRLSRCIKLLQRPGALSGGPSDVAGQVTWQREGKMLKASNPTPFYMNLASLSVAGNTIRQPGYIPPFGTQQWPLPAGGAGTVQWQIITDLGGSSSAMRAALP